MSRRRSWAAGSEPRCPSRLMALATLAVLAVSPALGGCGAGKDAQTTRERVVADSASGRAGPVLIRNAFVVPPEDGLQYAAGSDARVYVGLYNTGARPETFLGATTEAATSVLLRRGAGSSSSSSPEQVNGLEIASGDGLELDADTYYLELLNLGRPLRPGQFIELTFRFESAGTETLFLPVSLPATPPPRGTPSPEPEEGELSSEAPDEGGTEPTVVPLPS